MFRNQMDLANNAMWTYGWRRQEGIERDNYLEDGSGGGKGCNMGEIWEDGSVCEKDNTKYS